MDCPKEVAGVEGGLWTPGLGSSRGLWTSTHLQTPCQAPGSGASPHTCGHPRTVQGGRDVSLKSPGWRRGGVASLISWVQGSVTRVEDVSLMSPDQHRDGDAAC